MIYPNCNCFPSQMSCTFNQMASDFNQMQQFYPSFRLLIVMRYIFQLNTEWTQLEVIDLLNDGSGLGFGIIGGKSTGVVVKTILPGGVAERVR